MVGLLREADYLAIAPALPGLVKVYHDEGTRPPAATWSERHILYAAGLGTFSLSDGFITPRGIAMRCGSVVTNCRSIPATPRVYKNHTRQLPLISREGTCGKCIARCPAGAISAQGHDKAKCERLSGRALENLKETYGIVLSPAAAFARRRCPARQASPSAGTGSAMPELPDLEIIQEILQRCVVGATIERVVVRQPLVIRALGGADFATALQGQRIVACRARGKNLVFQLAPDGWLVITPMLAGRLRYVPRSESRKRKPAVTFELDDGMELDYSDPRKMGKVYLTRDLALLPRWNELGPEALDPALTLEAFRERLRGRIRGDQGRA